MIVPLLTDHVSDTHEIRHRLDLRETNIVSKSENRYEIYLGIIGKYKRIKLWGAAMNQLSK